MHVFDVQTMSSPTMSDDDADDDVVDDVTRNNHAESFDATLGGRGTYVVDSLVPEEENEMEKRSKGSNEDHSEIEASADQSSETVDSVSEIADLEEDDEEASDYMTDYTISASLEEKDHEALELERSTGLAQSTRETVDYVDSDTPSRSATPINEDLLMTLPITDVGSPIARSTMIDDYHSTDEVKDAGNVLLQNNSLVATTEDQKHQEDICATDSQAGVDLKEPHLKEDHSTDDSEGTKDQMPSQLNHELTAGQEHGPITQLTEAEATLDVEQQEMEQCYSIDDFKDDEGNVSPEQYRLHLTTDDQQHQEDSFTGRSDSGLDMKQPEDNIEGEGDDSRGQAVTPRDASDASLPSPQDQTAAEPPDVTKDSVLLAQTGDEDHVDREKIIYFGKTVVEDGPQEEDHNMQQDGGLVSSNKDLFVIEPNQIQNGGGQNDGGSLLGGTVTLRKASDDNAFSSCDQTLQNVDGLGGQEVIGCGKDFDENGKQDNGQDSQLAVKSDQTLSIADPQDGENNSSRDRDVEKDQTEKKGPTFQHDEPLSCNTHLAVDASPDHQKEIRLDEDRTRDEPFKSCQDPVNPSIDPDLSTPSLTPECLQLEVMSKSAVNAAERQLELVHSAAASNYWSDDEDKNNLLCLLDSRRKTQIDKNNWQLARHIQDEMALVKDAELDDLENVQVSVKVSWLCRRECSVC